MTYEEAVAHSKATGQKIKHEYFCGGEYFVWKSGALRCELGYDMNRWYCGADWQINGWSIVTEQ